MIKEKKETLTPQEAHGVVHDDGALGAIMIVIATYIITNTYVTNSNII